MNISCDMAMDLIALYCDGVASADSRKAVREHLAVCPVCSRAYDAYRKSHEQSKRPAPRSPEEKYAAPPSARVESRNRRDCRRFGAARGLQRLQSAYERQEIKFSRRFHVGKIFV